MVPTLRFLGYSVRQTKVSSDWDLFKTPGVEHVCSVSDHVNSRPEGWAQRWDYNRATCYDTEALAIATAQGQNDFQLFAYALLELKLDQTGNAVRLRAEDLFDERLPGLPKGLLPERFVAPWL